MSCVAYDTIAGEATMTAAAASIARDLMLASGLVSVY